MATLYDLKRSILGLLSEKEKEDSDPLCGTSTTSNMLLDAVSAAVDAITVRCYKQSVIDVAPDQTSVALPASFIEIEGVLDKGSGELLPKAQLIAGNTMQANAWHLFPYRNVVFSQPLSEGAKIYYSALWSKPSNDSDELEFPEYAFTAVKFFAVSHVLLSKASASAELRQFNTKVDSGSPINLPHNDMARSFTKYFNEAMARMPMMSKGSF